MKYVIGIDLGTSAVKVLLVNQSGEVVDVESKSYPLLQKQTGYNEQNPEDWVEQSKLALKELMSRFTGNPESIEGISFSGQMHGLVLLGENDQVLRPAILWNDTRTTDQCAEIYQKVGKDNLLKITKNPALEGFTLPKLLWVKEYEPEIYAQVKTFLLPKDYLRYKLTGQLHTDYSDAAGTLLLNVEEKAWSQYICDTFEIDMSICPPLIASHEKVGKVNREFVNATGLSPQTAVYAGGADNACGAIGSGVLEDGKTLCSIGTSGVVLSYESNADKEFGGRVHYFNHAAPNAYYTMGVTLSAGHSLTWFKNSLATDERYEDLLENLNLVNIGANGLLYTPYLVGERTPHSDASIRGSFIGIDSAHTKAHFVRAVIEGITFSLNESIEIFRSEGKKIDKIISTGGGAKNEYWLQIQANIFNATIVKLKSEQGPGMGAAMLAAYGCGWYSSLQVCADEFLLVDKTFYPDNSAVENYRELFKVYKQVYQQTKSLNESLLSFRT